MTKVKGMEKEVKWESVPRFKHIPTIMGECKEMNTSIPTRILPLNIGPPQLFSIFGPKA